MFSQGHREASSKKNKEFKNIPTLEVETGIALKGGGLLSSIYTRESN